MPVIQCFMLLASALHFYWQVNKGQILKVSMTTI